jgi:4-hydroxybenzoate polyprenyltransferase
MSDVARPAEVPLADALYALARPKLLPYVLLLTTAGYGWAHWDRALTMRGGREYLLVLVAWTLLHSGTLWLNAALDRDEGEVLMGRAVPVPEGITGWGYAALVGCVAAAFAANPTVGLAALGCAALAVLYSHPATAWKGHPLGGPFVNLVGYGLLTPLAGFACVGVPADARTLLVWPFGAMGVLGAYFAAQAFQRDEDVARGYRTLVATHGPRLTLQAARVCIAIGFIGGVSLAAIGWIPRVALLALAFWWRVDRWLAAWAELPGGGDERQARGFASRMLTAGLLGLALVFGEYFRASFAGEPVGGLGTAAGHPPDRPLLPPGPMRIWEQSHPSGLLPQEAP